MPSDKIHELLIQVFSDIRSPKEAETLVSNLFTESEKVATAKRLAIALFLTRGNSYEQIKRRLQVSSATIAKVQESLNTPGMKLALQKISVDEWAGQWASKLSDALGKLLRK